MCQVHSLLLSCLHNSFPADEKEESGNHALRKRCSKQDHRNQKEYVQCKGFVLLARAVRVQVSIGGLGLYGGRKASGSRWYGVKVECSGVSLYRYT
eukprot:1353109-Amorphochlora_amoeboformis.AAC.1